MKYFGILYTNNDYSHPLSLLSLKLNMWIRSGNLQKIICNMSHDWLLMNITSDKLGWHIFDGHFPLGPGVFLMVGDAVILVLADY